MLVRAVLDRFGWLGCAGTKAMLVLVVPGLDCVGSGCAG